MKRPVETVLIDRRNYAEMKDKVCAELATADFIGFDTETHDENAHENLKKFRGSDTASAFDWRRMEVVGFSIYAENSNQSYYVNIGHADVQNRLTWEEAKVFVEAPKPEAYWLCHNAPFELTVMANHLKHQLKNVICTMQMAVSCWRPDEYDKARFAEEMFGAVKEHFTEADTLFWDYDPKGGRDSLSFQQNKLLGKVLGKSSDSPTSYNGFIRTIAPGYGLKKLVLEHFKYQMESYDEVLKKADAKNMAEITGDQVAAYGADDAYWVVPLFRHILKTMTYHCPNAVKTFFEQENPMIYVFSDVRRNGIRIDREAVERRKIEERKAFCAAIRELKPAVLALFDDLPEEPNERLFKYEDWYAGRKKGGGQSDKDFRYYRERIRQWANLPDDPDDLTVAMQVSSSVTEEWLGSKMKVKPLNLTHYYQSRVFMYDLAGAKVIVSKGKVQSDAETRGDVLEELKNDLKELGEQIIATDPEGRPTPEQSKLSARIQKAIRMMEILGKLAQIEQRMKLYLAPYSLMVDPETSRVYPEITSMLATRRMACSNPNGMQLAKRGESTYIRGFYLPEPDHVFVAPDWSQIELVEIGDFSGDPEFAKAYGQLPYQDLHMGTAAALLSADVEGVSEEMLKGLAKMDPDKIPQKLLIKPNGDKMTPKEAVKFWRTVLGKGGNFSYWYSGGLSTPAELMGWDSSTMWRAVDKFRERFSVAEAWRIARIQEAQMNGFIELRDGHRHYKWEATYEWGHMAQGLFDSFGQKGISNFGSLIIKGIQSRAKNQIVNADIQGSCATLAKRSILRINERIKREGFDAQFKMPIHDELLYSVHKDQALPFITMIKEEMTNHPDIIRNLPISCSVGMGFTFEPWDAKKAPAGLVELDEIPELTCIPEEMYGTPVPLEFIPKIVEELYEKSLES